MVEKENDKKNKTNKEVIDVLKWFSDAGVSDISVDINTVQRAAKQSINTLAELKEAMRKVEISIKDCALNMVFGVGNEHADILLLGEAPGAEEDRQGIPFVGQSGQLLDKILAAVGLDRTKVYITNILPWRPPGNRTPTLQEITLFRPYVIKHISLVNPKIVVCLGGTATKALLQTTQTMTQLRGRWSRIEEISAVILPTFHPAYLLRSPSQKRETWLDFLTVKNKAAAA
ncbi:MAG: uracil-DNA glycosylase [Alphaproteobacteria bacterium]|nr:uracil-DNA glycosylase [Alphaproteobacteria bacterium]